MIIRKATVNDFETLKKLRTEFFLHEASGDERLNKKYVKKGLLISLGKSLRSKNEINLLAEINSKAVGFASSEIINNQNWIKYKKQGHLYNLYVIPKYQGKGIGKKLMEKSLKWFKQRKIKDLKILVYAGNKKAGRLYEKYGFSDYMKIMKKIN
jgi:ribosomal protein S18 acetylase RimI-like enzyme